MCFFDQHRFECGDWKWGHFRQHCNREYRTGETCGMKLIMTTLGVSQKCKICERIETKYRRRAGEVDRIHRWQRDGGKFRASIDKSMDAIKHLDHEIIQLSQERIKRSQMITNWFLSSFILLSWIWRWHMCRRLSFLFWYRFLVRSGDHCSFQDIFRSRGRTVVVTRISRLQQSVSSNEDGDDFLYEIYEFNAFAPNQAETV